MSEPDDPGGKMQEDQESKRDLTPYRMCRENQALLLFY